MQFYKTRDFSALITDTFGFFKEHGRNYFRNWLLLNGPLLILLVVLFIIGYRELFSQIAGATGDGNSFLLQEYFLENQLVLSLSLVAVFIIFLAASIISYTFPVLYMKRLSETGTTDIKADEILSDLRNNVSRFVLFFLGMLFVIAPIFLVVFGISYALMIIILFVMRNGPANKHTANDNTSGVLVLCELLEMLINAPITRARFSAMNIESVQPTGPCVVTLMDCAEISAPVKISNLTQLLRMDVRFP